MPDQKIDNLLNLALDATEEERQKSGNLNTGYDPAGKTWDVIVKYTATLFDLLFCMTGTGYVYF